MAKPNPDIETKLGAARTRLILERPFIGALVMHLPMVVADPSWCETVASDAKAIYYNPDFISRLTLAETQFMLAHEALHCALCHFARRAHRVKKRWDVACDYAVNQLLTDEGMKPPAGALINPAYRGLTAEEIYPLIAQDTDENTLDLHAFDGALGLGKGESKRVDLDRSMERAAKDAGIQPGETQGELAQESAIVGTAGGTGEKRQQAPAMTPMLAPHLAASEHEELAQQWKSRLASAAEQAARAGRLGESWLRALDHLIQPQLPWRMLLARYLMSVARDDYSFQRLSRREGEAILPSLHSGQVNVVIALDTSGSISDEEVREFAAEVDALKGQIRARITLHACDEKLCEGGPWIFESWEPVTLPKELPGGGGTRFTPVFEWIEHEGIKPDLLLYFTDAEGEFPEREPAYPVVWLVKGRAPVPWGERVQLN